MTPTTRSYRAGVIALAIVIAACEQPEQQPADTPPPLVPPPPAAADVTAFTQEQFGELRWLEGDWRGAMPNGTPFFESYRVINDTTVQMYSLSDSTLVVKTDSSRIYLSGGRIYNESPDGKRSVVERMDSTGVYFVPERGPSNRYVFTPISPNEWSAKLDNGVVYQMKRLFR